MKTLLCWVVMGMVGMMAGQDSRCIWVASGLHGPFIDAERCPIGQEVPTSGSVEGQKAKPSFPLDELGELLHGNPNSCDVVLSFRGSSKLIKDIFPEECGFPVSGTITLYNTVPIPEPSDVPAVNICDQNVEGWQICPFPSDFPKHSGWHYSCKQKTRILQHDEQVPPKYYCHKPETK